MRVLGVDPGKTGAAVLIEPVDARVARCLGAWSWRPTGSGYSVTDYQGKRASEPDLYGVSMLLLPPPGQVNVLVVEGLFAPRREGGEAEAKYQARVSRQMTLAQSKGEVMAALRRMAGQLLEPDARTWRAKVLRCGNKRREVAEAYALKVVPKHLVVGLGHLEATVHVCEAAAMAWYGWHAGKD